MFTVELEHRPPLYGEWRPKWAKNGNDFNAEIMDFGLLDAGAAGLPAPNRRMAFSAEERLGIERMIRALFASADARAGTVPFSGGNFLGTVTFLRGWIRH
jgi:hypothetical protein